MLVRHKWYLAGSYYQKTNLGTNMTRSRRQPMYIHAIFSRKSTELNNLTRQGGDQIGTIIKS